MVPAMAKSPALVPLSDETIGVAGAPAIPSPVLVTVKVWFVLDWPATTLPNPTGVDIVSCAGMSPVPEREAEVIPPGFAATESEPVFPPELDGLNTTEIEHDAPGPRTLVLHESELIVNSVDPVIDAVRVPVPPPPLLVTENDTGGLETPGRKEPNMGLAGVTAMLPAVTIVPDSIRELEALALALTVSVPDTAPSVDSDRMTWIVQLAFTARVVVPLTQSPAAGVAILKPAPLMETASGFEACPPVLVTVNVCTDELPATTELKFVEAPEAVARPSTAGFVPAPDSDAVVVPPGLAATLSVAVR